MASEYDLLWVAISVLIAIFASYTALGLAGHVAHAEARAAPYWIAGSAFAMGIGIWSMHFIGMLAFRLPIPIGYDAGLTTASVLLAIVSSGLAFYVLRREGNSEEPDATNALSMALAALFMGGGIAGMHYTGMAAMTMEPPIVYDPSLFNLSIVIAIGASGVALKLFSYLRNDSHPHHALLKAASALLMGLAIAGMHYTGMAAASFTPGSVCHAATGQIDSDSLAILTGAGCAIVLSLALGIAVMDRQRGKNAFYQALLDARSAQGEGIFVVAHQRLAYANDTGCAWLGYTAAEAMAMPAVDLLQRADWGTAAPVLADMRRGLWREGHYEIGLNLAENAITLSLSITPFVYRESRRFLLILLDITARKRMENLQQERERFLRKVLYQQSVAAFVIDAEHRVISWNRACEELTGVQQTDVLGKAEAWRGFYRHARPCAADLVLDKQLESAADYYTIWHRRPTADAGLHVEHWFNNVKGKRRYLIVEAAPIVDRTGNTIAVIETVLDVSHMKQVEEDLEVSRRTAEAANLAKSQFLANMSHEIRTPLNGVLGMAQLLMMPDLSEPERLDYAKTIASSGEALLTILNDILDLSKIEAGRLKIVRVPMKPARVIQDVVALFAESAKQKDLTLDVDVPAELENPVLSDPIRLRQILSNLVGNAVKFTHQGGITLRARRQPLAGVPEESLLYFEVQDTGIGIDEESRLRLFQRFSQADASNTRHYGGTGLGLAICQELCHLLGGEIGVESQVRLGSTFWFSTQAPAASALPAMEQGQIPQPENSFSPDNYRVLIVEDNPVNLKLAQAMLARLGYRFDYARNGQEAVDTLHRERYDAILMDCHMPVLDGWEATRRIREREQQAGQCRTPIIALTAAAFGEDHERCRMAGMDDFLSKPFNREALSGILRQCLSTSG